MTQIIVQAGGRGTRLEHHTTNRPKCLVPVDGKPLLYHTFDAFPGASFTVIVDYRGEVVRRYLDAFPPGVPVRVVEADGDGTCGGIAKAAGGMEQDAPAVVVWSDLLFREPPPVEDIEFPVIFTTEAFPCRMFFANHQGIFGLFSFPTAAFLSTVPKSGEFAEWAMTKAPFIKTVITQEVTGVREFGTAETLRRHWDAAPVARSFNAVEIGTNWVEKRARLPEFQHLIDDEVAWYEVAGAMGFATPFHDSNPLVLERIRGRHPFEMPARLETLLAMMDMVQRLHGLASATTDRLAVREMYVDKTLARLAHIPRLAPDYAVRESIRVNGRLCRNILHEKWRHVLQETLHALMPEAFAFIHGDPTFSNMLIDDASVPWLIDPRGRFGRVQFYGDPAYDWAKLWYSVAGGYDQFNRRRFVLEMDGLDVRIDIAPSGWESLAPAFADLLGEAMMRRVRILHGLIWLSLSGYVTEDYDQVLGAWFEGMLRLEEGVA